MRLLDVNVLVAAHRRDAEHHVACRRFLDEVPASAQVAFTMPVITGFLRVVTHPTLFSNPTPTAFALQTVHEWTQRSNARWLAPRDGHLGVFRQLCQRYAASGGAFYDLHIAALAIEYDAELVSLDRGFSRIRELRWRVPDGAEGA